MCSAHLACRAWKTFWKAFFDSFFWTSVGPCCVALPRPREDGEEDCREDAADIGRNWVQNGPRRVQNRSKMAPGGLRVALGLLGPLLGPPLGRSGALLGDPGSLLGSSWALPGRPGSLLGPPGVPWSPPGRALGGHFGSFLAVGPAGTKKGKNNSEKSLKNR